MCAVKPRPPRCRTSARAGGGVEVVLMGAAVVLALPKQQNSGRVAARRADPGRVTGQTLAVTGCRVQEGQGQGQSGAR